MTFLYDINWILKRISILKRLKNGIDDNFNLLKEDFY